MASHFKIAFLASGKVILKLMNKRVTLLLYRLELQMSSASVGLWGEIAFFRGGLELNESTERWRLLGAQ